MSAVRIESLQTTYSRVDQYPILTSAETQIRVNPMETFGQTISRKINSRGMSLGEVGSLSKVNKSAVLRLKRGETRPKISTILKLDRVLDFTPYEILGWLLSESYEHVDSYYVTRYLSGLRQIGPDWKPDPTVSLSQGKTPQEKFREYRKYNKKHEMRQRMLAARVGGLLHHSRISRFESGDSDIYFKAFLGLCISANLKPEQTLDLYYSFGRKTSEAETRSKVS